MSKNNEVSFNYYYDRKNYDYKGIKNFSSLPEFVNICKYTQKELKLILEKHLKAFGYKVIIENGFIYAKGEIPVLLTAHMDTVHKKRIKNFYEYYDKEKDQHIISSPEGIGGDDRCGIYMILDIIKTHKCSVLFCEDEEIGGIGSMKFCSSEYINDLSEMKYMIELDRANGTNAVFYDCFNEDFMDFIEKNTGYKEAYGSFSDISNLAPKAKVAAVNLSCGYYNAHTTSEYVIIEEMLNTIEVVKNLLEVECEQFEYIEDKWSWGHSSYGKYSDYYNYESQLLVLLTVDFIDPKTEEPVHKNFTGNNKEEAWGKFFIDNPDICYNEVLDYNISYY